jgi:hypothetical protein
MVNERVYCRDATVVHFKHNMLKEHVFNCAVAVKCVNME